MKKRPMRRVLSDLNSTIQATMSPPAEVLWDLRYTVTKKKFQSVTSKTYFAGCSIPKDNCKEVLWHFINQTKEV